MNSVKVCPVPGFNLLRPIRLTLDDASYSVRMMTRVFFQPA